MNKFAKMLTGAAAAALVTVSVAAPAEAQRYRRHYDRGGIDAGDIITGVAIIGGIAAIASALDRDGDRYGYGNRYRYRDDYRNAVNSCGYEAERYGRGARIQITDVDRRGSRSYRVRGVIDTNRGDYRYGNRDYGYGGRDYGYGDRYDRYDRYDRHDRYDDRLTFTCKARDDGRITDFDVNRYRY